MSAKPRTMLRPRLECIENRCLLSLAVVDIVNATSRPVSFDFRWTSSSGWTSHTEMPGQESVLSTTYSTTLTPQVQYSPSLSQGSKLTTDSLVNGYGEWSGAGAAPASAGVTYEFLSNKSSRHLYYLGTSPTPTTQPNPTPVSSTNWSGYVVGADLAHPQTDSVSAVYGTWVVPTVTGPPTGSTHCSVWIGIDGSGNGTVEQVGIGAHVDDGKASYEAWWEMWSKVDHQPQQTIRSMTVKPGDTITASVVYIVAGQHAGQFELSIDDTSRPHDSFTTYEMSSATQNPPALRTTAEWIVEAPEIGGKLSTLANFGAVPFTSTLAAINDVTGPIDSPSWQSEALDLAAHDVIYDTTSVLTGAGKDFVVAYNPSAG
jgi:Peptidase A4 family